MNKRATLLEDEFYPSQAGVSFWMIPKPILADPALSHGAKLLYSVLFGLCLKKGTAWPSKITLQKHLGGANLKSIYRWQKELEDRQLLRVHQKGRGLPNNYYLLRSPLLGNMDEEEFADGPRYVHKNLKTGQRTLVEEWLVEPTFRDDLYDWLDLAQSGTTQPLPKPCGPLEPELRAEIEREFKIKLEAQLAGLTDTAPADTTLPPPTEPPYESLYYPIEAIDIPEAL